MKKLFILFIWLPCVAFGAGQPVSIQLSSVSLVAFAQATFKNMLARDFVISPDALALDRKLNRSMNIGSMKTPDTREEFETNFHFVLEQVNRGKFNVLRGVETGLEQIRFLPNGRIDLLSIDERARVTANTMATFAGRFKDIKVEDAIDEGDGPGAD